MKIKLLLTGIMLSLLFTLCSCSQEPKKTIEFIDSSEKQSSDKPISHIDVYQSDGPGKEFLNVPLYYNNDYPDIQKEYQSISAMSLLSCLSMLNSYYSSSYVTPIEYSDTHKSIISTSVEQNIYDMADSLNMTVDKYSFDTETLSNLLTDDRKVVLLYIPHTSIFGKHSSFMLLTGVNAGNIYIRDPNNQNTGLYKTDSEPFCDCFTLCEQASSSAFIYVFNDIPTQQPSTKN